METNLFHFLKCCGGSDGGRRLLDDLLVPPLDGAVSPKEGDGVSVLVSQYLDLKVSGMLRQLHDEDRGAGYLRLHLHSK